MSDSYYWLASPYVRLDTGMANFSMYYVNSGCVGFVAFGGELVMGNTSTGNRSEGVRAVVSLSSDIKLSGSSEAGWTY